jgi:polar amino acid transport system substrate-binding protein
MSNLKLCASVVFFLLHKGSRAAGLFSVVALIACSQLAVAAAQPVSEPDHLRIAYVEFPPYTYQDNEGNPAGSFIDITRKVVKEAGYRPEFVYLPISRAYLYLASGKVDIWVGLTHVPKLKGEVLESRVTPVPVQLSAWYRSDGSALENLEQLEGKTVIVIGGYTYGGLIDWLNNTAGITVTEAPNHRAAIEMLKRKRGDYVLDYREPVKQILTLPSDSIVRETGVRTRHTAWIFSLANPQAALLRDQIDSAYLRLVNDGKIKQPPKPISGFVIPGFPKQYL